VQADYVAEGDEYFTQETFLDNGSYPIHGAFIRQQAQRGGDGVRHAAAIAQRLSLLFTPIWAASGDAHDHARRLLPGADQLRRGKNFNTVNPYQLNTCDGAGARRCYQRHRHMYRMFLWTLIDELQRRPPSGNPTILNGKIKRWRSSDVPEVAAQNGAPDSALIAQARDLVGKRPSTPAVDAPVAGCHALLALLAGACGGKSLGASAGRPAARGGRGPGPAAARVGRPVLSHRCGGGDAAAPPCGCRAHTTKTGGGPRRRGRPVARRARCCRRL